MRSCQYVVNIVLVPYIMVVAGANFDADDGLRFRRFLVLYDFSFSIALRKRMYMVFFDSVISVKNVEVRLG
jgi:hypothetical protein